MSGFVVWGGNSYCRNCSGGNSYFFYIYMKNSSLGSSSKNGPMGNAQYGVFLCCNMDLSMASLTSLPLVLSLKKKKNLAIGILKPYLVLYTCTMIQ